MAMTREQRKVAGALADDFMLEIGAEFGEYIFRDMSICNGVAAVHKWHWPRKWSGGRWDHWLYVMEYGDGSFSVAIDTSQADWGTKKEALRKMAKADLVPA